MSSGEADQVRRILCVMNLKRKSLVSGIVGVVAALIVIAVVASGSSASSSTKVVSTGHAAGKTVLVNNAGRTLYTLSAETNGRFICTGSCLSTWHPLTVRKGQKPSGAKSLGTVKRSNGQVQVTYKGRPLYTFAGDTKRGDAKGEGFKDVGTWHAAVVGSTTKAPAAPAPMNTSPSYPSY
jgi:predicted lipoprotein with Yx(FWY)xxD motif